MDQYGLRDLRPETTAGNMGQFCSFLRKQLDRYSEWQAVAEDSFQYIPRRCLIPIRTASEMYKWTGKVINSNPCIVYHKKVKPSVPRLLTRIAFDTLVPV
jgi:phytoene synthase